MRQVHHWAALVFLAAIVVHVSRVFFTGAFRRPREINWVIGVSLLLMALATGIAGYSLPDDLLSGTGLRIVYSVVISIPFIGPWLAYLVFGGDFPTRELIGAPVRLPHPVPAAADRSALITVHLGILWLQKHTQFRGGRATETQRGRAPPVARPGLQVGRAAVLVSPPCWPSSAASSRSIRSGCTGRTWRRTSASPSQPDWYMGWLEGALRLVPELGADDPGRHHPEPVPARASSCPASSSACCPAVAVHRGAGHGDHREHHLLELPWEAPARLAVGSAALTTFVVLTLAGANDVLAVLLNVGVEQLTAAFRVLLFVAPVVVGLLAYRLGLELRARSDRPNGPDGGVLIQRTSEGGFEEVEP